MDGDLETARPALDLVREGCEDGAERISRGAAERCHLDQAAALAGQIVSRRNRFVASRRIRANCREGASRVESARIQTNNMMYKR